MEENVEVRNVSSQEPQEQLKDNIKRTRRTIRKLGLAYTGLWALAYDEIQRVRKRGQDIFDDAEQRGEDIEKRVRDRLSQIATRTRRQTEDTEQVSQEEVENQITQMLGRLGIPSRDRVVRLSTEIEQLSRKIDQQLQAEPGLSAAELPISGYDGLNVKEVVERLQDLTIVQLRQVRLYEVANENRVTVLREIDARIQAMPIPAYDQMTVEDVEAVLPTLTPDQLASLKDYEQSHENRVTLLRTIARAQEERSKPAG